MSCFVRFWLFFARSERILFVLSKCFFRECTVAAESTCMRSVRSAFPEQAPYYIHMGDAWARYHAEPRIPAPDCNLAMLKSRRLLRESGEEAAICLVLTMCTAPARLGAVVLASAWLEDGPHGARDHSVWQWLSLMWRLHCSEARPWRSLSGLVPKIRRKAATSASTAGRRRCRVRGPTPTRVAGTPSGVKPLTSG